MHRTFAERIDAMPCALLLSLACLTGCATLPAAGLPQAPEILPAAEQALEEGDVDTALAMLKRMLQADPLHLPALQMLVRLYGITGDSASQLTVVKQILAISPEDPQSMEYLGLRALAAGQLGAAAEYLELAIATDPNRWPAINGLGVIADEREQYAVAQAYFLRGLAIVPGHPKLMANLGWSKVLSGEFEAAEVHLRASLERSPEALATQSNLAFCIALQGRYDEAVQLYTALYDASVAANNVGYAALARRDRERAAALLAQALRLRPSFYVKASNNLQIAQSP